MDGDAAMTSQEALAAAITAQRKAKGMSQEHLAGKAGVSRVTIQNLEAGRRTARPSSLQGIAAALDTTPEALLAGEAKGQPVSDDEHPDTRWNLLERAQMLREMADEYERQAREENSRRSA